MHREDWFNEGRTSTKERFPLRADEVVPLLSWNPGLAGLSTVDPPTATREAQARSPIYCRSTVVEWSAGRAPAGWRAVGR